MKLFEMIAEMATSKDPIVFVRFYFSTTLIIFVLLLLSELLKSF